MDLVGEFHPPSSKGNRVCTNCCLYVDRFYFLHSYQKQVSRRNCDSPGKIISPLPLEFVGNYSQIMALNLKMTYFLGSQRSSDLKGKFIHLHTDLNLMDISKDFTDSSKVV